jgi:hypothetical protein
MLKRGIHSRYLWLVSAIALAAAGCGSRAPSYSPEYKARFEKRMGADEAKARAFVLSLASVPKGKRNAYVRQHWGDAKNLSLIPDQDLQTKYKSLMSGER